MTQHNHQSEFIDISELYTDVPEDEYEALFDHAPKKHPVKAKAKSSSPRHVPIKPDPNFLNSLFYEAELKARRKAEAAKRKAQKEKDAQTKTALVLIGLNIIADIVKSITKPDVPVPVPSKEQKKNIIPDSEIIDAEFKNINNDLIQSP